MKSGATDPFADDTDEEEQTDEPDEPTSDTGQTDLSHQTDSSENTAPSGGNTGQFDRSDLPFILRRDNVKDERESVHQLFILDETDDKAREAERELEDRLGDVYRLGTREAIYRAGMQNLDDAESILREWGIDV